MVTAEMLTANIDRIGDSFITLVFNLINNFIFNESKNSGYRLRFHFLKKPSFGFRNKRFYPSRMGNNNSPDRVIAFLDVFSYSSTMSCSLSPCTLFSRALPRVISAFLACLLSTASAKVGFAEPPKSLNVFLDRHCLECHDDVDSEADLNLWDLEFDLKDPAKLAIWQRVFERIRDGEMPPAKKPRPEAAELAELLPALKEPLLAADRIDAKERGRVRSRRLTRLEYEHTLHDLLGIDLQLKDLLPEDPASHGFETVADGQQLSYHLLARYLDVADLALAEAFDRALNGDATYAEDFSPSVLSQGIGRRNYRGPEPRNGESISWPIHRLQFYGRMRSIKVPEDGWYRITLRDVRAINPATGGTVWGTLRSGAGISAEPILYDAGIVEATEIPRDLQYEAWIRKGHLLELKPNDRTLPRAPNQYKRADTAVYEKRNEELGFSGIAHSGIRIERIYPNGDRAAVRKHLFGDTDLEAARKNPKVALNQLIARFAHRAFRRPATETQLAPYQEIAQAALAEGDSLEEALRAGYRAILCSPRFLTFIEKPGQLDDYALASRLSYALWVSMPDRKLTQAASEGKLRDPKTFDAQINRMLSDAKFERFINSYGDQWLNLKEIGFTNPDRGQFPTFDPVVQESMLQETRSFLREMIQSDRAAAGIVDSDFAFWNERLARHYEVDAKFKPGQGLQKVSLQEKNVRGGLLTQGAILKVTADGSSTSPIVRGVFVNERILGEHLAPPPPDVPAIEPDIRGAVSIRDQLDKHRSNESCYSCHKTIDPPGLALENFDPVGKWRTRYGLGKGAAVDAAGATPEGERFADILAWKKIYAQRDDQLARAWTEHFLTYATGAPMRFSDHAAVDEIVAASKASGYGLQTLMKASLASLIFQQK